MKRLRILIFLGLLLVCFGNVSANQPPGLWEYVSSNIQTTTTSTNTSTILDISNKFDTSDDISLNGSLSRDDLLGFCNYSRVDDGDFVAVFECIGNFFNPVPPNPMEVLILLNPDRLGLIWAKVNILPLNDRDDIDYLNAFVNAINPGTYINFVFELFKLLFEFLFKSILYLVKFIIRFGIIYVFYVSLGFQIMLKKIDRDIEFNATTRIFLTGLVMLVSTIFVMSAGTGWLGW